MQSITRLADIDGKRVELRGVSPGSILRHVTDNFSGSSKWVLVNEQGTATLVIHMDRHEQLIGISLPQGETGLLGVASHE